MATVKTVQKSHLNLSLNWSWISAFNILWIHWKILQKIRTLFRIDSKARGAQIRVHSKELPPAAHFSVADGFWPKKKSDKIWILLGGLPFFGSTNPVITYFNITCQRGWLKYNWVFNAVIKSFVNSKHVKTPRSQLLFTVWCKFLRISILSRNLYATLETHRNALSQMSEHSNKPNCFGETLPGLNPPCVRNLCDVKVAKKTEAPKERITAEKTSTALTPCLSISVWSCGCRNAAK